MKKGILIIAVLLAGMHITKAQGRFYIKIHTGYGVPTTKEASSIRDFTQIRHLLPDTISKSIEKTNITTLGSGIQLGGALGIKLSENLDFEFGAHYLMGANIKGNAQLVLDPGDANQPEIKSYVNIGLKRNTRQIRVVPSLVVHGDANKKIMPYARFGLMIPVGGKTVTNVTQDFDVPTLMQGPPFYLKNDSLIAQRLETKGKLSLGFQSAVGMQYNIRKIGLFIEVAHQALSVRADKTTLVNYTENGNDRIDTKTVYEKETHYMDEMNSQSNNMEYNPKVFQNASGNYDRNAPGFQKPKEEIRLVSQFSNIGVNIGLRLNF